MAIIQAGSINPAATLVAGVYVVVVPPPVTLQGAPTDVLGIVGVASWGPANLPVALGDPAGAQASFGLPVVRKHDLSTAVTAASLQGASSFRCVRVTDGTDVAATATVTGADLAAAPGFWTAVAAAVNLGSGVPRGASAYVRFAAATGTFTALYTGIVGNTVTATVSQGSKVSTFRLTVQVPGFNAEVFDNLAGGTPLAASHALAGGTDGDTGVTALSMLGSDASPRTGMYALRGNGCAAAVLMDCDSPAAWSAQIPFGQSEGVAMYVAGPQGETIASAASDKAGAGVDDYSMSVYLGDWLYWNDEANDVVRLVSPAVFAAAKRVALAPNYSTLNAALYGVLGSQHAGQVGSGALVPYSAGEIEALVLAGICVVGNPSPGGAYWSDLVGHNSSSGAERQSDTYTAMTNFFAKSFNSGMGVYVGKPNSLSKLRQVEATLSALCAAAESVDLIGDDTADKPYSVTCDESNNPQARRGLGYTQADIRITYQGVTEKLLLNLQGGSTVTVGP